jgi:glycosyltransferase involved in cell wall biosynthesis
MLKPGALSIKSRKKQSFLFASRSLGLFNGIHWAATDRAEQDEVCRHFGQDASVYIAPNIPRRLIRRNAPPLKHPGSLRLYTIARVSAEKNIHAGIEFLSKLPEGNIELSVYGTIQDRAYLTFCLKAAETAPHITVHFKGAIDPEDMPNEVAGFHFMFLPTLGENFGHVIAEALAMGIPVIISNRTPWRDLFGRMAGWDLPLDEGVFCKVLIECLEMDHATYLRFCDGAHNEAMRINDNDDALKANLTLFAATRNEGKN